MRKATFPLLLAIVAASNLRALPIKDLTPAKFEASQLFKDYPVYKKGGYGDLIEDTPSEVVTYDFTPTGGSSAGFSVVLEVAGPTTKRMLMEWMVVDDPKSFMAGRRHEQVQKVFHILGLDKSADAAADALAGMATASDTGVKKVSLEGAPDSAVFLIHQEGHKVLALGLNAQ